MSPTQTLFGGSFFFGAPAAHRWARTCVASIRMRRMAANSGWAAQTASAAYRFWTSDDTGGQSHPISQIPWANPARESPFTPGRARPPRTCDRKSLRVGPVFLSWLGPSISRERPTFYPWSWNARHPSLPVPLNSISSRKPCGLQSITRG